MRLKTKIQLEWIKARAWLKQMPIFVIYLFTQPFVEIWKFLILIARKSERLNHPRTWMPIFFALTIISYLSGNKYVTNVFGTLLLITIIKWEWDKKDFVHIHRERVRKRIFSKRKEEKNNSKTAQTAQQNAKETKEIISSLAQKEDEKKEEIGGQNGEIQQKPDA